MRATEEGLVKNPVIIQWARRTLMIAGAATSCCEDHLVRLKDSDPAVRRAVIIARLASFESLSPDAGELAVLETYLQLPDQCTHCRCEVHQSSTTTQAD